MTQTFAKAGLNVVRTGPRGGTPVVLIHPAGLDLTYWDVQIGAFSADHDVIAFDLPGHGLSPGTAEDWSVDRVGTIVARISASIGVERVHLVGISLGGMVAQACALAGPSHVASMTLIDTAATFPDGARTGMHTRATTVRAEGMAAVTEPMLAPWFTPQTVASRPDLLDRIRKTLLADDPQLHGAMWDFIAEFESRDALATLVCPTLVIVGDRDETTPVATAVTLRDAIPGADLRVIANAAHLATLERPELVNRHILSFLARVA
jgi:3-oxoadipate enol-lactonase